MSKLDGVTFGPPTGEGWQQITQWRRIFPCTCGYLGFEYWNEGRENTLVCTKCGNGRRATTEPEEAE